MVKKSILLASTVLGRVSNAYANTMAGGKLFICATPQPTNLTQNQYEALVWVQVKGVGNHGETGTSQNVVSYNTWDTLFSDKGKGIANAGDPVVEVARIAADPGQALMRTAAAAGNQQYYAFKIERNDAPSGGTPTKLYNRGLVTGPVNPNGENEAFDLERYTLGLVQEQITVNPSNVSLSGTPATGTEGAAYTFTPTITGGTGPFAAEWYGENLAPFAVDINATTGALTATAVGAAGTLDGVIIITDSLGARATLPVSITFDAA